MISISSYTELIISKKGRCFGAGVRRTIALKEEEKKKLLYSSTPSSSQKELKSFSLFSPIVSFSSLNLENRVIARRVPPLAQSILILDPKQPLIEPVGSVEE